MFRYFTLPSGETLTMMLLAARPWLWLSSTHTQSPPVDLKASHVPNRQPKYMFFSFFFFFVKGPHTSKHLKEDWLGATHSSMPSIFIPKSWRKTLSCSAKEQAALIHRQHSNNIFHSHSQRAPNTQLKLTHGAQQEIKLTKKHHFALKMFS